MAATSEQRRAAVVRRIKALGPQPRPVFRSGVDIDAVHYRMHPPKVAAPDDRPLGQAAGAEPAETHRPAALGAEAGPSVCAKANEGAAT